MKSNTKKSVSIIMSIIISISIFTCIFSMIYDVEQCTIYEVSHNKKYCEVTIEHDNNLYSAKYGLNMLDYFIKKADAKTTVIFYNDEIITII